MRRTFVATFVGVVLLAMLYVVLRATSPSPAGMSEADTMCFASRIGLRCAP